MLEFEEHIFQEIIGIPIRTTADLFRYSYKAYFIQKRKKNAEAKALILTFRYYAPSIIQTLLTGFH